MNRYKRFCELFRFRKDTVFAKNVCQRSQRLCGLFENFEGFSQILKEQSGDNSYLDVFTHPIAIIKKKMKCSVSKKIGCR